MPILSATLARLGFLPKFRSGKGLIQVILPEWSYDFLVGCFFPVNWFLTLLPTRVPVENNRPDWPLDPDLVPGKISLPAEQPVEATRIIRARSSVRLSDREIWSLFDSLPAPTTNEMIGNWRGKVIYTGSWIDLAGHLLERPMHLIGWDWGKRFFTPYRGDPFMVIIWNKVIMPVPIWGGVSLPEIRFRGKCGATMAYDHQPWKDHFRILDDGRTSGRRMLLGNWMSREKMGGWFTLEEMPGSNDAVQDLHVRYPE